MEKFYRSYIKHGIHLFLVIALLLISVASSSYCSTPVYAKHGMAAGSEENAVQAGVEILKSGGNAFDAAAAIGFALAVTYPAAGNLGGGGFMVAQTKDGRQIFLDFRETAPVLASRDMYVDDKGDIIKGSSTKTALAVGVPGTVHGLFQIINKFGTMNRQDIIASAIRLADEGFQVSYSLHSSLQYYQKYLSRFASTADQFYVDGKAPEFGSIFKQSDLAWSLRQISEQGSSAFYRGAIADKIVQFMSDNGGIITKEDLKSYTSKFREPVKFDYKNYSIIAPGLPSSGGIVLAQILKLVEPIFLRVMGRHSAEYVKTIVEAERLAFADRNYFLGDSDFVKPPVEELISDEYLDKRRSKMKGYYAKSSVGVAHGKVESNDTTHYCVADKDGNVVAITYTLNGSYGMGGVVDGAGFLLNNEMDDFSALPGKANMFGLVQGEANAIEPGKRMLSSMSPTIILKDGKFAFTVGSPGGPTIITTNLQVMLNMFESNMNIRDAIDAGRFHHQWLPDVIAYERFAFSPDTLLHLVGRGYTLHERRRIGFAVGIQRMNNGILAGYSDRRGDGVAVGY